MSGPAEPLAISSSAVAQPETKPASRKTRGLAGSPCAGCARPRFAQPAASRHGACCDWAAAASLRSRRGKRRAGAAGSASHGIVWRPLHPGFGKTRYPAASLRRSARARASAIAHRRGARCRRRWVAVWPPALCLSNLNGNRSGFAITGGVSPLRATFAVHAPRDRLRSMTAGVSSGNHGQGKEGSTSHLSALAAGAPRSPFLR